MSDELRDRIAAVIRAATDNGASKSDDYAQAIIEDLGLVVEKRMSAAGTSWQAARDVISRAIAEHYYAGDGKCACEAAVGRSDGLGWAAYADEHTAVVAARELEERGLLADPDT